MHNEHDSPNSRQVDMLLKSINLNLIYISISTSVDIYGIMVRVFANDS